MRSKAVTTDRKHKPSLSSSPTGSWKTLSPGMFFVLAAVTVAAIFALYSPALNFQFILDDHHFVGDPRIQTPGHIWEYFTSYVWSQVAGGPLSFYRPTFALWLRLNSIFCGMSPWGWHLLSVAKHASVAVLLGLLVWKLLHDRMVALIAGGLFALHPAQTESVAWVTVPDPLMAAAVLGSLYLYLCYADRVTEAMRVTDRKSARRRRAGGDSQTWPFAGWLIASAASCLVALLTKETAIVLPATILVLAFAFPLKQANPAAKSEGLGSVPRLGFAFRQIIPFICVTAIYLLLRLNALGGKLGGATQHLSWSTVLLSWPATLWFYVKVIFWPVRSRAFADPVLADRFSVHGVLLPGLEVCCAVALLVWGLVWAWKTAQRTLPDAEATGVRRALLLGASLLILPILPTLNLNALDPGDLLHGRYAYLPLAGLMLLLASGWRLANNWRNGMLVATTLVAVLFSVLTVKQEGMWKDDLTVFTVGHQIAPHNAPVALDLSRAHVQVALSLDEEGRCDQAEPIFNQAIQQYPDDWFAWAGLGECQLKENNLAQAEHSLQLASELSHQPRVTEMWQMVREKMGLPFTK